MTPAGARLLHEELDRLLAAPRTPGNAVDETSLRIRAIQESLRLAEVVERPDALAAGDVVRFGATVTMSREDGSTSRVRIVGVDEANSGRSPVGPASPVTLVSWLSPLARALMDARVGDTVELHLPSRDEELEILAVAWE